MIFKLLALTIPQWVTPRAVLVACLLLALFGCSTASKKPESKELAKLSLDSQEEAQKLRDDGNLQAAAAKYQEALRYHPSPSVHYELGDVLEKLGRNSEAKAQYDLALARNPNMPEATQALERLNAKIELAGRSMEGGPVAPLSAPVAKKSTPSSPPEANQAASVPPAVAPEEEAPAAGRGEQTADAPTRATETTPPPPTEQVDVYDEERAFREMEELKAPPPSQEEEIRTNIESPSPIEEPRDDSESLMADTEEIYGAGRGTDKVGSASEAWEPTEKEPVFTTTKARSRRTAETNPAKSKPLKGGRGLLNSLDSPPVISYAIQQSSPENSSQPEGAVLFMQALDTAEMSAALHGREPIQVAEAVTGKPGERGLGSRKRLPSEAPVTPKYGTSSGTKGTTKPSFSSARTAPQPSTQPKTSTADNIPATPAKEEKGFLDRIFSPDEITYPEPPTPDAEKALPSPYGVDREELDLRPFHTERLKGKRKVEYEIETCKNRYYKDKDLEGAVRCFNDKKIDFPENAQIYYELGLILEDAGDYAMARKNLEMAVRYDPNNEDYRKAIARMDVGRAKELRLNGDYSGAQVVLKRTLEKYPDMVEAHREMGRVYSADAMAKELGVEKGSPATPNLQEIIRKTWMYAEQAYQEVVNLSEGDYKDWYNLGVAIQKQNRNDKRSAAIKAYEQCISLNPEYANAHYHLGILYESSNVAKAIQHYEIALAQARRMPKAEGQDLKIKCLGSLGELNWRTGNKERAAEYLTEYIQYAPGDAYIEEMLNQITSEPTDQG